MYNIESGSRYDRLGRFEASNDVLLDIANQHECFFYIALGEPAGLSLIADRPTSVELDMKSYSGPRPAIMA